MQGGAPTGLARIRVVDFDMRHVDQARRLAEAAYAAERASAPALPPADIPDLASFATNGLGVAAVDGDTLLGFMGCLPPWDGAFGNVRGTFVPVHAHGTIPVSRAAIYERLYQAAAARWVANGILGHAIALYAHDHEARRSLFDCGFGGRTIDAIRDVSPIDCSVPTGLTLRAVGAEEAEMLASLDGALAAHLRAPPMFMPVQGTSPEEIARSVIAGRWHHAAAFEGDRPVAYLRWEATGETFVSEHPSTMNITGAYTLPEARGSGVSTALLALLIDHLREQGYERCGVDFETFNAPARYFWLRHFAPYTLGVARRIDERIREPGPQPAAGAR